MDKHWLDRHGDNVRGRLRRQKYLPMVREVVAPRLHEADGLLGSVRGGVRESMSRDAHIAVGVAGVQVENWVEG